MRDGVHDGFKVDPKVESAMKPAARALVQVLCTGRTPPVTLPRRFFLVRSRIGHRA
ncbi:hypothetical protein SBD_5753 [Streptomyces bottropensis ATCC 25435]|uniref:Uncharacterized protein n=1 Tax=Streptomyces bottropensis ATCC 25435 TaxID=1054862 RepID=M3E957_9ACTN|nr:hypothetical protein SBD_5753 [Streptomyces bottropensis ATCC 25435]